MSKKVTICQNCGRQTEGVVRVCPYCGAKIQKPPFYKRKWFIILAALLVIMAALGMCGRGRNDDNEALIEDDYSTEEQITDDAEEEPEEPEEEAEEEPEEEQEEKATDEVSPDFKEAMDSYEAFFDEYVEFIKKYQNSSDAAGMLTEYADYMTRYAEYMSKLDEIDEDELSTADLAYYTEVNARIMKKLAEIA